MRSLLLTSAAVLFTATAALAQTTPTSPAPNGAPNAAAMTAPGASPGNTGSSAGAMPAPSGTMSPSAANATPAPTGAPNAAQVTAPGASPGNMAPAPTAMNPPATTSMKPMKTSMGMGHMSHMTTMPEDADTKTYLHIAAMEIKHGNKAMADDALSRAETRELTRAVPQGSTIPTDDSPTVSAIESARKAVAAGDMKTAMTDTKQAMHMTHGGMGMMQQ